MRKPDKRQRKGPKQGLTPAEQRRVDVATQRDRERWEYLFSLNKWRPIK